MKCDDIADQPFTLEIIEGTKKKNPSVPEHIPCNATLRHVLLHCCDIRTVPKKVLIPIIIHYVGLPSSFYRRQLKQISCLTYDKLFPCHYRPQTKLQEGNVFTAVCLSTGEGDISGTRSLPFGWVFGGSVLTPKGGYVQGYHGYMGHGILRDMVNKWAVHILLECFPVNIINDVVNSVINANNVINNAIRRKKS